MIPGAKVGHWTLLAPLEGEKAKWLCRCDCGTQREVLDRSLRYGGSQSCGCIRKQNAARAITHDLTGQQFGELTVLRRLDTSSRAGVQWLCRCACGEECSVTGTLLVTGKKTRCTGNAHEKKYAYTDITGQKFEKLTALYPSRRYDKSGSVIWRCRCDCGREVDVSYNNLRYGNQKSCGCQKKEHDQKLSGYLTHVAGTSIDMLKSKKVPKDNTTGYRGVYFIKGKYVAKIVFRKKQYFLGSFDRIEDAAEARREAEEVLFDGVSQHYRAWKQHSEADPAWGDQNPIQVLVDQENGRLRVTLLPVIPKDTA